MISVHPWLRHLFFILLAGLVTGISLFSWVAWLSPRARVGHRNEANSLLVQPGMSQQEALALMGPPAYKLRSSQRLSYMYAPHPFASSEVTFWVGTDSLVAGVGHGN